MFENLTSRMSRVVKTLRGEARLTEANTQEMLREVRLALLEADVSLPVVREFIGRVKEKALGEDVVGSLTPGQALVGVVNKELTALMGGDLGPTAGELSLAQQPPAVILMAGLQGSGKTTTTGKLARWLAEGGHSYNGRPSGKKKVLVVSADVYRPAAIEQLKTVAAQAGVDFLPSSTDQKPEDIARNALDHARRHHHDVLIVDTAGRLGIDEKLMLEIQALHKILNPIETLFVVDAMLGQDAVNVAKAFNDALPLTGVVLTKLDGDSRGGAALSVRHVTGKPLKFIGVSEKLAGLEPFHPERMAQRVLGMGDILSLVEEAHKAIDINEAQKLAAKLKSGDRFDPACANCAGQVDPKKAEGQLRRMEGILNSMTPAERSKPELLKASRKRRIAAGSGVPVQEVNRLLAQFDQMQGMMKQMKKGGMAKMMRAMGGMKALKGMKGFPGMK